MKSLLVVSAGTLIHLVIADMKSSCAVCFPWFISTVLVLSSIQARENSILYSKEMSMKRGLITYKKCTLDSIYYRTSGQTLLSTPNQGQLYLLH